MRIIIRGTRRLAFVALLVLTGCGGSTDRPPLGTVVGTVTLNGAPLGSVEICFSPAVGRPSYGDTNSMGKFELTYVKNIKGAKVGKHTVTIHSGKVDNSKMMPVEIKPGRNVIDVECVAKPPKSGNQAPLGDDAE